MEVIMKASVKTNYLYGSAVVDLLSATALQSSSEFNGSIIYLQLPWKQPAPSMKVAAVCIATTSMEATPASMEVVSRNGRRHGSGTLAYSLLCFVMPAQRPNIESATSRRATFRFVFCRHSEPLGQVSSLFYMRSYHIL